MIAERILRVTLVGAESTGKTTLAKALVAASVASVPGMSTAQTKALSALYPEVVPEAARLRVEQLGRALTVYDIDIVARSHVRLSDALGRRAQRSESRILLQDTDLVSTLVYAEHYYRARPKWIGELARRRIADLYLFCQPDLTWEPEPGQRGDRGDQVQVHVLLEQALNRLGAPVVRIEGESDERLRLAADALGQILGDDGGRSGRI